MRKKWLVLCCIFIFIMSGATVFGADYFLFDKETNKIMFMGENDTQFTEKIEMEKNPDLMMPTDNPSQYLAVFTPEEAKKGKTKDAQKGKLIIYNMDTNRTEDLVELGYAPFRWTYTRDHRDFFISYRSSLDSESLELLHYNIAEKRSEVVGNLAKKINYLVLSYNEDSLFALIPGNQKEKKPGEVLAFSTQPLTLTKTIPCDVSPFGLFILGNEKIALVDADPADRKHEGKVRILNSFDYSMIEEFKFAAPYKIQNFWYPDDETLVTVADTPKRKSFAMKVAPGQGIGVHEIPSTWIRCHYINQKNSLYILTLSDLRVIDYEKNQVFTCKTDGYNIAKGGLYDFIYISESLGVLYCPAGGKVKFVNLMDNTLLKSVDYGRPGVKFGNFLVNLAVSVALTSASYYSTSGYGYYYVYSVNLFKNGAAVAAEPENNHYFILGNATRDITVLDENFKQVSYIVPPESPIAMYQLKRETSQTLLVSGKKIYLINPGDLSLKPVYEFKTSIKNCFFFDEDNRLIILTDKELLVMDPLNFEIKNSFLLYGNPDEKYQKLKKGELRYYFIPAL